MTSIYQRVLGSDFARLHPEIQRRFGFASTDGVAAVGHGVMDEIWRGRFYTLPFLYVGTWRRIMFPETGRNMPFTIENYAFAIHSAARRCRGSARSSRRSGGASMPT